MDDAERTQRRPTALAVRGGPLALLAVVVLIHVLALRALPSARVWGDEELYLRGARQDAAAGTTSLLPGRLRFDHRPELAARVFSHLVDPVDDARAVRRVAALHIVLLVGVLALTFVQGRLLGLSRGASLGATALLACLPWHAFYVHALWPEVIHALLLAVFLAALLAYLTRWRGIWLLVAGLAGGAALLAKGTLVPFVPVLVAFLGVATWRGCAGLRARTRVARTALAVLVPALGIAALIVPQMRANAAAGHGWRLSANFCWNLELGVTVDPQVTDEQRRRAAEVGLAPGLERWLPMMVASRAYGDAAFEPVERERLACERVRAYVGEHGLVSVGIAQVAKLGRLVATGESGFEQSLTYRERWPPVSPAWLRALRAPGRILWYAIWLLGLAGLALTFRRSPAWLLLALFTATFLAAMLAVPFKIRFLMPLVPVLCLFAGAALDRIAGALRQRLRTSSSAGEASHLSGPAVH